MKNIKDAVNEMFDEYISCHVEGDRDRWMNLWTDNGAQMPPGSPAHIGKENIRKGNKDSFSLFNWEMNINVEEIREADGWGFATGNYDFKRTNKESGEIFTGPGKFLTVFEKQDDGSLKFVRDIFNFDQ